MRPDIDPILYVGIDIGLKRDTSAIVAIYDNGDKFHMWGLKIFTPPVNMITQVEPVIERLLKGQRIAGLFYDPMQFETTRQRLQEEGYGDRLVEVNQMTEMTHACTTLQALCEERGLLLCKDADLRSHFTRTAVKMTERGPRLVKASQAVPVDATVATAMAVLGATTSDSHTGV